MYSIASDGKRRPKSKYAEWEDPPQEGEAFDYDATPNRFYFEVETAGGMEPDQIIQGGIRALQQKIGGLLKGLDPRKYGGDEADMDGPRSPDMQLDGGTTPWQDAGYNTSYGGSATAYGSNSAVYAGSGTAYGGSATSYGQGNQNSYGGSVTSYGTYGQGGGQGGQPNWQ
jgi:DNA-directed RNA polymerase II subunit RPB3